MSMPRAYANDNARKEGEIVRSLTAESGFSNYLTKGLREGFEPVWWERGACFINVVEDEVMREQLLKRAAAMVDRAVDEMRPVERSEEEELWKVTDKEVEKGWLRGPFTREEGGV
eukprot:2501583-Amphidinium_carterae.1